MISDQQTFKGIRPAAVAGYFYPDNPVELKQMVTSYLDADEPHPPPKAIIVPHAGYIYSGPVAASAYCHYKSLKDSITRVLLLGPAHRVYLQGMALSSASEFNTPLGNIVIDQSAVEMIRRHPDVLVDDAAHEQEHSLEVQLPFLQMLFSGFKLIPLLIGDARPESVADVIEQLWGGKETIIIISSDLSHYHPYEIATEIDKNTAHAIESFDNHLIGPNQACGCMPLGGLLIVAKRRAMKIVNYDLKNSGDTAGDRQRVVGYGAWGLY